VKLADETADMISRKKCFHAGSIWISSFI